MKRIFFLVCFLGQLVHASNSNWNAFKTVSCGDRAIDPGEECDDGNLLNGDGCNSVCGFEGAITIENVISDDPSLSFEFSSSYDDSSFFLSNGNINFSGFLPSSAPYDVGEINLPNGWEPISIDCTSFQSNIEGNDPSAPTQSTWTIDLLQRRVFVNLVGAELVRCVFTNAFTPCVGPSCSVCANGLIETGEECDDGNVVNGDGCNSACMIETCGDDIINNAVNGIATEACDLGDNNNDNSCGPGTCTRTCQIAICPTPPPEISNCVRLSKELADGCSQSGRQTSQGMLTLFLLALSFAILSFSTGRRKQAKKASGFGT